MGTKPVRQSDLPSERECKKCHEVQPLNEKFFRRHTHGYHHTCRMCRRKYAKDYYCNKNVVRRPYVRRENMTKNRVCRSCKETKPLTEDFFSKHDKGGFLHVCVGCIGVSEACRKYRLSRAEYDEMYRDQGNGCAICGESDVGKRSGFNLSIDHCHSSGSIRGLLCSRCNLALGYLRDDADLAEKAAAYLRSHNAVAKPAMTNGHGVGKREFKSRNVRQLEP
jgi:hypothetical protein